MAGALGTLGLSPEHGCGAALLARAQSLAVSGEAGIVGELLAVLAALPVLTGGEDAALPAGWMSDVMGCVRRSIDAMGVDDVCDVLRSVARTKEGSQAGGSGGAGSDGLVQSLASHAQQLLEAMAAEARPPAIQLAASARLACGFASVQHAAAEEWLHTMQRTTLPSLLRAGPSVRTQDVANLVWGVCTLASMASPRATPATCQPPSLILQGWRDSAVNLVNAR